MRQSCGGSWVCYLLLGLLAGCSPSAPKREIAEVKGTVSYKGKPLKMGKVTFQPPAGAGAVGEIQADGTYSLQAVVAKNSVMVVSREEPKTIDKPTGKEPPPKDFIPPEYGTPQSKLTFDVKAGTNKADFDLQ